MHIKTVAAAFKKVGLRIIHSPDGVFPKFVVMSKGK